MLNLNLAVAADDGFTDGVAYITSDGNIFAKSVDRFGDEVTYMLFRILDIRLFNQANFLVKFLYTAGNNFINNVIGFSRFLGLGNENFFFFLV